MSKEELIGKLQMVYVGERNALNELIGYYDGLKQGIEELQQENQRLKDNWNKLKEYTQEKYDNPSWASCGARYVLEKMQELEQGKDE